jgi:hypothetical protein
LRLGPVRFSPVTCVTSAYARPPVFAQALR